MNKQTLKELFELERQLGVNEKDRFHNTKKGKELYGLMFNKTEQELENDAKKYIAELSEKSQDYRDVNIVAKKAKELYDKFYHHTYKYHSKTGITKTSNISKETAKELALIVVCEILNEPKMKFAGNGINDIYYKFWKEVRKELEKQINQ